MKIGKLAGHAAFCLVCLLLLLGLPFSMTSTGKALLAGTETDTTSSASVLVAAPSGSYVMLVNREFHTDEETLELWRLFLTGEDDTAMSRLWENAVCTVASSDTGAVNMAESFQSRLGTSSTGRNQLELQEDNAALVLSRADAGKFDMLLMSQEFMEANGADSAITDEVMAIWLTGSEDAE